MATPTWKKIGMATKAAYNTFLRVYGDPEGEQTRFEFEDRAGRYRLLWHYYQNSVFEDLATWTAYKARYKLYRHTRSIYNPGQRLVDFYAGIVYPGALSMDASRMPHGATIAIPLAEDTNPQLRTAIGQLWQWSNWQTNKALMVRYGAALGDVLVEVIDEVDNGKVYLSVVWPGLVTDLRLDEQGNVKMYTLEYDYIGEGNERYTYRREIDGESIRTYRNNEPHAYEGVPAQVANPYGFAPAVWIKHKEIGGDHGEPAMRNLGKLDELNGLASHALDQAHRILAAPIIVSGKNISTLAAATGKQGSTAELPVPEQDRESIKILRGEDASVATLQMDPGETLLHIDKLMGEIERDHPEITMYHELRQMSQVTGPAAERLFGDVEIYVNDARAAYDTQSIKLFQMAVAIGGWRAGMGDWGRMLNQQQSAFLPFDLDSYTAGDLNLEILPRPLIPATRREALELERLEQGIENDRQGATMAQGVADRLRLATQGGASA